MLGSGEYVFGDLYGYCFGKFGFFLESFSGFIYKFFGDDVEE